MKQESSPISLGSIVKKRAFILKRHPRNSGLVKKLKEHHRSIGVIDGEKEGSLKQQIIHLITQHTIFSWTIIVESPHNHQIDGVSQFLKSRSYEVTIVEFTEEQSQPVLGDDSRIIVHINTDVNCLLPRIKPDLSAEQKFRRSVPAFCGSKESLLL